MIPMADRKASQKPAKGAGAARQRRDARLAVTEKKRVYALVDLRDAGRCRVCGKYGERHHHHHLQFRSQGGEHSTSNIVTLCYACHEQVHARRLWLSGDADGEIDVARTGPQW